MCDSDRFVDTYGENIVQAHVHSMGLHNRTLAHGREVMAMEGGCLCTLYPHYCRQRKWKHGMVILHHNKSLGACFPEQVPIMNGRFFYGGKLWEAKGVTT